MHLLRFGLLLLPLTLAAQITPENSLAFTDIANLEVSPDGNQALFVTSTPDLKANRSIHRVMQVSPDGAVSPVPGLPDGAGTLRWAPDSKRFAYIAAKAIWVHDTTAASAIRICAYDHPNSFTSKEGNPLSWSPDGTQLAFAGTTDPAPKVQDPIVIDRIQYKTRTGLSDNRRIHLFVVPASGGTPRPLTNGHFDEHSLDWGGNGKEIIFLSNRNSDPDAVLNYDILAVDVQSGRTRQITHTAGVEYSPVLSPDGKWVACIATARPVTTIDSVAEDTHLYLMPAQGGQARDVTATLDRRITSPQWSSDGSRVYFLASDHGKILPYEYSLPDAAPRRLFDKPAQVTSFSAARSRFLFVMSDPVHPPELYTLDRQITHLHPAPASAYSVPDRFTYKSYDGLEIEAWLYPALQLTRKVPLILSIHGGPHGLFGYAFTPVVQLNAARGYATLMINPRGSAGYGQKFADGTINDWGGGDFKDLMAGLDVVLAQHPEIDRDRLGVTGPSYGGYMTNWAITQTKRFKAAVAVASISNLISFYATSLYQDLVHAEFQGHPWDAGRFSILWKVSPLAHIAEVSTPTLFIHGESDNDVHITQAEEMYTALRMRGIPAEFARYPREGHSFHEPKHILDSRIRTLDWMDRFLKANPPASNP